ncbi:MAG: hypothetical protein FWF57_10275 [Defluviitaleaceae bacterium]|nr:hypothetical protein [Defluviitaleaceae bacterium]
MKINRKMKNGNEFLKLSIKTFVLSSAFLIFTNTFNSLALANTTKPQDITLIRENISWIRRDMWQQDLEQFRDAVLNNHPRFWDDTEIFIPGELLGEENFQRIRWNELETNIQKREDFVVAIDDLIQKVSNLTDFEIFRQMHAIANIINDAHFDIRLPFSDEFFHLEIPLPIAFRHFGGEDVNFYLLSTVLEFGDALNHRLIYVNGVPIEDIINIYSTLSFHENEFDLNYRLAERLSLPLWLEKLGLEGDVDFTFTLEHPTTQNRIEISLTLNDTLKTPGENFLNHLLNLPVQGREIGEIPRFFERGLNSFEILENEGILYINLRQMFVNQLTNLELQYEDLLIVLNEEELGFSAEEILNKLTLDEVTSEENDQIFSSFIPNFAIVNAIQDGTVNTVIIDARGNGGGNIRAFANLFTFLSSNIEEDRLFYLIDNGSFSAASIAAVSLQYLGFTLVGEPTGQNLIFHSTLYSSEYQSEHELRNSGIFITVPNILTHLEDLNDGYIFNLLDISIQSFIERFPNLDFYSVFPHVTIEHTIQHFINNEDPLLEYVIESLNFHN